MMFIFINYHVIKGYVIKYTGFEYAAQHKTKLMNYLNLYSKKESIILFVFFIFY
jgi:hypothetical protein